MTMTYRSARWLIVPVAALSLSACGINSVPTKEEAAKAKWANVEAAYQRRADLIPNLVETAKGAAKIEQSTLEGVIQARESKYIMMHAPTERLDEVIALLPGAERPTILPLAGDQQRVAMHMVSSETLFWETMEKLKAVGGSSILVLPIEKMME